MKLNRIKSLLFTLAVIAFISGTAQAQTALQYFSLTPCRVVDTRNPNGPTGGPALVAATRSFPIQGNCGVPVGAKAVSVNVTVALPSAASHLTLWPSGTTMPTASTINFTGSDSAIANGAIVPLSTNANDLSVFNAAGTVHLILDVTGYFQ